MTDFLDRFPPEMDDPIIEDAARVLVKWAQTQDILRNMVRFPTNEAVLFMDPDAMTKVLK